MLCKAVTALPNEGDWTFEIKFDGYRCLAVKNDDEVRLFSRNENGLNARFPSVVEAFAALPRDFTVDGEIVALDKEGRTPTSTPPKQSGAAGRSLLLCFPSPKSRRSGTHSLADSSGAASYCAKSSPNQELRFDCHPSLRRMPRRSWAQSAS